MIILKVSEDFTKTPGGRYKKEGKFSGEEFRTVHLLPKYKLAQECGEKLQVDLDGCYGFAISFIEETFGGLARELKSRDILKNIIIISKDEPGLINDIKEYVKSTKI